MNKFVITTDYTCDIYPEFFDENDIVRVVMPIAIDGEEYDLENKKISSKDLYDKMRAGAGCKTSQANQFDAITKFNDLLNKGYDILHLCFSSGVSSTFENFTPTVNELSKKFPDNKVIVVDTLCGSGALGLLLNDCLKLQKQGKSIEEVAQYCEENKLCYLHYYIVQDLAHLKKGGRINAIEATIGTILGIKPVLSLDYVGKINVVGKVRGQKKAFKTMVDMVMKNIIIPENDFLIMAHSDCLEDAKEIGEVLTERTGLEVKYCDLTCVIGSHVGPNTVAVFFKGHERQGQQSLILPFTGNN